MDFERQQNEKQNTNSFVQNDVSVERKLVKYRYKKKKKKGLGNEIIHRLAPANRPHLTHNRPKRPDRQLCVRCHHNTQNEFRT